MVTIAPQEDARPVSSRTEIESVFFGLLKYAGA